MTTRRDFLRSGLAGGAFLALPAVTYKAAFGADVPPSEKIRIGCIGVGNQGTGNMKSFLKNVVAVGEVDTKRMATAAATVEKAGTKPQTFGDYRKMLEMKDLDAVVITTPDHWHALMTIHACEAGKDVYCEKPLTLTIAEGRAIVNAARKNKRIVQTGSQQRSSKEFRQGCELVRNGAIGKVKQVLVGLPGPNFKGPAVPDAAPPAELNYDLWLGPAPERPYNEKRGHYLFRFFWDYSGGQQTNFGAHHLDIAQWGLGMDNTGPTEISATATFNKDKWFETPETAKIEYTYANGIKMLCSLGNGGYPSGTTFEGEKGKVYVNRGKIEVVLNGEKVADPYKLPTGETKLIVSNGHHAHWLACIKSRELPITDCEIGHRSATVCHLGNIAVRTGKKIAWDPAKEEITGDPETAKMVSREYRKPWSLS